MRIYLKIAAMAAAVMVILTQPLLAQGGKWGNEAHHTEMQSHHDTIRPHMNDANAELRQCARSASQQLNANDWHAARGYANTAAWNARRGIMEAYASCAERANQGGKDLAELRRNRAEILSGRNDIYRGIRGCVDWPLEGIDRAIAATEFAGRLTESADSERNIMMGIFRNCKTAVTRSCREFEGVLGDGNPANDGDTDFQYRIHCKPGGFAG